MALGGQGNNKIKLVEEGCIKPLIDLLRFPDPDVQLSAVIAVASIILGKEPETKAAIMTENGLQSLIDLVSHSDNEIAGK